MTLKLGFKPFSFHLLRSLRTSQGIIKKKEGWLIKLENKTGRLGWGEIAPLNLSELNICGKILEKLGNSPSRQTLEEGIPNWPGSLAFAIGAALAEIDYLIGNDSKNKWLSVTSSALLLPNEESILLNTLQSVLDKHKETQKELTFKWKIRNTSSDSDLNLLKKILFLLPENTRLRIDANGGLNRIQAHEWAQALQNEARIEWLEQPLAVDDIEGMNELAQMLPIALDESLIYNPSLRKSWTGWQIRRPLIEGDPRILLKEFKEKNSYISISTSFETGIGKRWIEHFAALQLRGLTPTQPGLAPGWCPKGPLFCQNPQLVWEAA
ncbi:MULTISPECIES: o-succinylbenzoate synthase [Prochlorococcus]|uniref:O-succinylbenzoate-CoA synthase n=1 Tax=Prochlorococcus marinus (strain SARG / CCMP1375 / SS120) TaxID=167539 RepID=Q7VE14_PROMA|nr:MULTISPECIES: o-succinylbenzoate synthase [Prochlorococcus]AAP99246.1 O-succinylbenzoate-CoA synthase [Prochlorococcus marinus subsp. marinus str. CCMP1375]KGG11485.1 O-succinylbenzoate synthase [Prochlorococcus marinus str. LG]KGG18561.1 O-succinylbenzoate synthase [Prochlorococcus marinus str. SS2]KGG22834.1 O-succinylbenzoate synthase [Prochlorococcus marinus str. SS35]KGG32710.1 O-succinylbenzoate synthase [Prochlorococcus marinus str. SS51]